MIKFFFMSPKINEWEHSTNLTGTYKKRGANLTHREKGFTLVIGTRKKTTITKPPHYLLLKHPSGKFEYLSSLFPLGNSDQTYSLDTRGRVYQITISGSEANIKFQGVKR